MYRIFISHSGEQDLEARALKQWLVDQDPPLANEIFLDSDPQHGIRVGRKWKDELRRAMASCEAVICLVSEAWNDSGECIGEFRSAEFLNKRIFCVRLENTGNRGVTTEYQRIDLFGTGEKTAISLAEPEGPRKPGEQPAAIVNGHAPAVSFLSSGLLTLRDEIIEKGIGPESFVWPPPRDPERSPYRGWEPLDEVDAAVYFGRDAEIIRATDMLRGMCKPPEKTLFVVLGPSGAGKSSFLRAGLLPRLRRADRDFVVLDKVVRPETGVITGEKGLASSISATLKKVGITGHNRAEVRKACQEDTEAVRQMLQKIRVAAARPRVDGLAGEVVLPTLVIPLDQAEELFARDEREEAPRFLELIKDLTVVTDPASGEPAATDAESMRLIVALTIRTDHHEALQTAKQLAYVPSMVFDDLKPLPSAQFREVIVGPAKRAEDSGQGLEIEEALVNQLLEDCQEGADTLPLLALTLARLYEDYGDDGLLELSEYETMGGVRDVVQTVVDGILTDDPTKRETRLALLRPAFIPWLATINRRNGHAIRRQADWDDLPPDAKPLLQEFIEKRLLVRDKRGSGETVEVALESLLRQWKELKEWLELEADDLKQADAILQGAQEWQESGRTEAWLLKGERLASAKALLARPDYREHLSPAAEFMRASEGRAREDNRNKYLVRAGLAAAVVVALVAGFIGWQLYDSYRHRVAQNLVTTGSQMLDGGRAGGDVLALQLLLAAGDLGGSNVESVVNDRRDLIRIMENPLTDGDNVLPVWSVAVGSDGKYVASANEDGKVRLWHAEDGAPGSTLDLGVPAKAVAFNPDGQEVVAGGAGVVALWNSDGGQPLGTTMAVDGEVRSLAFSGDGGLLAAGTSSGHLVVWATQDRTRPLLDRKITEDGSVRVAFPPADSGFVDEADQGGAGPTILATGDDSGRVNLWNATTDGRPIATWRSGPDDMSSPVVTSVAISPTSLDGTNVVAAALTNGRIAVLDGKTLKPSRAGLITAHADFVNSIAFSSGGTRIVSAGSDNTVRVWNADSGAAIGGPLVGHHGSVQSVAFNPAGTEIISGGFDGSVRLWDAVGGLPIPANQGTEVRSVAFRPGDGGESHLNEIASGGTNGTVMLWNPSTGAPTGRLGKPSTDYVNSVNTLAYSPAGDRIVTGGSDGALQLWDVSSLPEPGRTRDAPDHRAELKTAIKGVAFNADGTLIVSGDRLGRLMLWDGRTLAPLGQTTFEADVPNGPIPLQVWSVAFGPDGRVASGSGFGPGGELRNLIQVWDVDRSQPPDRVFTKSGEPIAGAPGYNVYTLKFDDTGKVIAAGTNQGTITQWDVATGDRVGTPMSGDQNPVMSIALAAKSPDRPWMVSGALDGKVRYWDRNKYEPIGTPIDAHSTWVHSVAISPDESKVVSGGADGTIHLWQAPLYNLAEVVCDKLNSNMSHDQWERYLPWIPYREVCPGKPIPGG